MVLKNSLQVAANLNISGEPSATSATDSTKQARGRTYCWRKTASFLQHSKSHSSDFLWQTLNSELHREEDSGNAFWLVLCDVKETGEG